MKLHVILILVLVLVAWLMPLIYQPATPYAWILLAIYVVAVVGKAVYNWFTIDRKNKIVPAVALLLLAAGATACSTGRSLEADAQIEEASAEKWATMTYTDARGYDHTVAGQTWK